MCDLYTPPSQYTDTHTHTLPSHIQSTDDTLILLYLYVDRPAARFFAKKQNKTNNDH